jgi:adenylate cyclase
LSLFRYKDDSDRGLETEIMASDRLRSTIVGTAFGLAAIGMLVVWTQAERFAGGPLDFLAHAPLLKAVIILAALGIYEFGYRTVIAVLLRRGLRLPLPARIFNATVETSVPTAGLYLLSTVLPPETALNLPPVLLYYFFLALSTLRLDPWLAFYTGVLAGAEFAGLSWLLLTHSASTDFIGAYVSKGSMMAVTGIILAFVTQQIRSRIVNLLRAREQQEKMASIFGQHVSPAVMQKLLTQKSGQESETRHVTVMFLDIRDFTTFAENRSPEQVVGYLNRLFSFMVDAVNENQGIINKFLGDGFMAVFGAPLDDGRSEYNAVNAALAISDELRNALANGLEPTRIGIGLHSGPAVTGNVGSSLRKEYTIIGDVVNLASRIESQTKSHAAEILVSKPVWDAVSSHDELAATSIGGVTVKGREAPVELFRVR